MADRLDSYRSKRDFDATPEPGGARRPPRRRRNRFVVQEHHARRCTGTCGWSATACSFPGRCPKGIPADRRNHLAVHTEDHPLEY